VRTTAPNPTRRRRLVEIETTSEVAVAAEVKRPAWECDRPEPRKCLSCGTQFSARGFAKTCSPECSRANLLARERRYRTRFRAPPITECERCGKKFENRIGGPKTCSSECLVEYRRIQKRQYYLSNRDRRMPQNKQCVICGHDFVATSKANACSPTCKHERQLGMERARRARHARQSSSEDYGDSHERVPTDASVLIDKSLTFS
jgi:hypothetical protein